MSHSMPQLADWTTLEELSALQERQLPASLEWASRSPFYRERFGGTTPQSWTDVEKLEVTTKQDLRDNYPFGLLAVAKERLATYHESSGTAGQATPSYYTADDWVDLAERFARKWIGWSASDTFLVRTPYALLLTGHLAHAAGRHVGATVVPGDNRSLAMPYPRVVQKLHDLEVTLTWSVPTECLLWAASARALGYDTRTDFPALRAFYVGGEPLTQARRERIADLWGAQVVEEYGSTETGTLAGECSSGNLHLWADRAVFEVYHPETGTFSRDGSGQLVVTTLYREAMPLVRYNLEDNVEVSYEPCDCGWALPTVKVLGRTAFGHTVGDIPVTQYQLEDLVFRLPAEYGILFWRARAEPSVLRIEIEVDDEHRADAVEALTTAVRDQLEVPCEVTPLPTGTLVPLRHLTEVGDVVKPRSLFGPDEDWSKALLYY